MKKKDNTAVESIVVAIIIMFATIGLLVSLAWSYDALDKAIVSENELREELRLYANKYHTHPEYERDKPCNVGEVQGVGGTFVLLDDIADGDTLDCVSGTTTLEFGFDDPKSVYNENNI